jgi:hypothetical protein
MNPITNVDSSGLFIGLISGWINIGQSAAVRFYQFLMLRSVFTTLRYVQAAYATIANAYSNQNNPIVRDRDASFAIGLIAGAIGTIIGLATSDYFLLSGASNAYIVSITEIGNRFYATAAENRTGPLTTRERAYYFGKFAEIALSAGLGHVYSRTFDSLKESIVKLAIDFGVSTVIDDVINLYSFTPVSTYDAMDRINRNRGR